MIPLSPKSQTSIAFFPGDGVCPLPKIIRQLIDHGFTGTFSLELFNPEYWERDPAEVASEGLEKSRAVVQAALQLQNVS